MLGADVRGEQGAPDQEPPSVPAREVVIGTLGTIFNLGESDEESEPLKEVLRSSTWPDGRPVFTLPMVIGLLIFYAWCLQCAATLAVIRRETNSWRWPVRSPVMRRC